MKNNWFLLAIALLAGHVLAVYDIIQFDADKANENLSSAEFLICFMSDASDRSQLLSPVFQKAIKALEERDDREKDTIRSVRFVHFPMQVEKNKQFMGFLGAENTPANFPDFLVMTKASHRFAKFKLNIEMTNQSVTRRDEARLMSWMEETTGGKFNFLSCDDI